MAQIARTSSTRLPINHLALRLVGSLPSKAFAAEARAVFTFVQRRIRYVRDIAGVETVRWPERTLDLGQGDCDDQVVLLAALLGTIGYSTRYVAMGTAPGRFEHVFLEVRIPGELGWLALDPTEPYAAGWRPSPIHEVMIEEAT